MFLIIYILVPLLINFLLFFHNINGTVVNCTVRPAILQQIPELIGGTIAIANSSNEEIFWSHVEFKSDAQFPLNFIVVINNYKIIPDRYTLQLHIYRLPRETYDLPLWSADTITTLIHAEQANFVEFIAFSDRQPIGPCITGIIFSSYSPIHVLNTQLKIQVGSMPLITLHIYDSSLPVIFKITDIPQSMSSGSTKVSILISNPKTVAAYEATERVEFNNNSDCAIALFRVSEERSMNLTIIMSAHMFTSISLLNLAATYRIYKDDFLIFKQSDIIDTLQFPYITQQTLVPITSSDNYTIEATIFGSMDGYFSGMTLFQGVTNVRLIPGTINNVSISMLYTGVKIGTTIIGTIRQTPSNLSTWSLKGWNLAFAFDNQQTNFAEAEQFIIFDQTFPIEFTILNIQSVTRNYENVIFSVTITYLDATVVWEAVTLNNKIIFDELNRLDINVSLADGYVCQSPGKGYCDSSISTRNLNDKCCSQYKCSSGQCRHAW